MNSISNADKPTGRLLARNVAFSLIGQGLPILVALITMPLLIRNLETEKFGVLALAWVLAGYFNIFDLGLGRAIVRVVVQRIPEKQSTSLFEAIWAAFTVSGVLGLLSGLFLYLGSGWLANHFFSVQDDLQPQVELSLKILAVAIPFTVNSTIFRGTLEGFQKFDWINFIQVPIGSLTYLLPWLVSHFTHSLPWIIGSLVILRVTLWANLFVFTAQLLKSYPRSFRIEMKTIRELLRFGFWITTSNVINPIMAYMDRFLVGSLVSISAVAYYTAPMEMTLKLPIIPNAVLAVMYPAFASYLDIGDRLWVLFVRSFKFILLVMLPICFLLSVFSHEILSLWIGANYAEESSQILRIAAIGIFANCLAHVPLAYLQANNRPSIPAMFHVAEFPIYAALLYAALTWFGLLGAVFAWSARVTVDAILLYFAALYGLGRTRFFLRTISLGLMLMGVIYLTGELPLGQRVGLSVGLLLFYPALAWYVILSLEERIFFLEHLVRYSMKGTLKKPMVRDTKAQRVGIAMAVYKPDADRFLRQIKSLQGQTLTDWKCVMTWDSPVNDLLKNAEVRAVLSDPRFEVIENPKRLGAKKNFEEAIRQLCEQKGIDAVAFCDQDDYWYPHKLEVLLEELNSKPMGSLVHCDMRIVHEIQGRQEVIADSGWYYEARGVYMQSSFHLLVRNVATGAASMMDRELLESYRSIPASFQFHDHWYAFVASCHGGVYPIRQVLYDYIQHEHNVVGVLKYGGVFYYPSGLQVRELCAKFSEVWVLTEQRCIQSKMFGIRGEHGSAEKPKLDILNWAFGPNHFVGALTFFSLGIAYLRSDGALARRCFINGVGRLVVSFSGARQEVAPP